MWFCKLFFSLGRNISCLRDELNISTPFCTNCVYEVFCKVISAHNATFVITIRLFYIQPFSTDYLLEKYFSIRFVKNPSTDNCAKFTYRRKKHAVKICAKN